MNSSILAQFAFNALITGSLYAAIAASMGIIASATKVFNFAQGETIALGAFVTWYMTAHVKLPFWAAVLAAVVVVVIANLIAQRVAIGPLIGQPLFTLIMATFGLSFVLRGIMGLAFGTANARIQVPISDTFMQVGVVRFQAFEVIAFVTIVVLLGGIALFFHKTKIGLGIRATASREDVAELMGVRVQTVHALAWGMAAVVGAVIGIILGKLRGVHPDLGGVLLMAFPALVIGGLDNVFGAIVGGFVVGAVENLIGGTIDVAFGLSVKEVMASVLLVVLLAFKPYGFFGKKEVRRI